MTIYGAMLSAAIRLVGQRPSVFFGSTGVFEIEICDLINEVAKDILASHDWQGLTKIHGITADGTDSFPKPDDYDRMALVADMQRPETWLWGYYHAADINEFMAWQDSGFQGFPGAWTLVGDRFTFSPIPSGEAKFAYISNEYAIDNVSLTRRDVFEADTDGFVLPERLLTLGLVWRWREQKKLDFTGDQEAFAKALSEEAGKDKGSRVIRKGSRVRFRGTFPAWSGAIGPY
jgi:hypothetical protein